MRTFTRIVTLGALSFAMLALPGQAFADYSATTTTTTTTTTTDTPPLVGSSTTYVTTTDRTMASTTNTVRGTDGMLYTTTMTPVLQPDAFYTGPADLADREGYGSMYDLNRGYTHADVNGIESQVDLTQNRADIKLADDALYEPAFLMSDGFARGEFQSPVTQFDAYRVDIDTGTTVTFWAETGHHDISEIDGPVETTAEATIDPSRTWSHTFNTPGYYRFIDGFGGGPLAGHLPGILIHVSGPQKYAYLETTSTVASLDTTTAVSETTTETQATVTAPIVTEQPQPTVQVEATQPKPKVVKPKKPVVRDTDLK